MRRAAQSFDSHSPSEEMSSRLSCPYVRHAQDEERSEGYDGDDASPASRVRARYERLFRQDKLTPPLLLDQWNFAPWWRGRQMQQCLIR